MNNFIENKDNLMTLLDGSSDLLSLVVKSHHSLDTLLNFVILQRIPNTDAIELERVTFLLKVDLAIGLSLFAADLRPIFNLINTVRNRFAHNPYSTFSEKDMQDTKNVILSRTRKVVPDNFKGENSPREVLETLFAIGFINAVVAYENACKNNAEARIANEMATEVLSGGRKAVGSGLSIHEDFRVRLHVYLRAHHPEIDNGAGA